MSTTTPTTTTPTTPFSGGKRDKKISEPKTPYGYRPTGFDQSLKVYKYCVAGLEPKFKTPDDKEYPLWVFQKAVQEHLENSGMDEVFYFKKKGEEYSIIEHYALFTIEEIQKEVKGYNSKQDLLNLDWSATFLKNSLDSSQLAQLQDFLTLSGPELWMHFIMTNQSASKRALRTVIHDLEPMSIHSYPSENVKTCVIDIIEKVDRLERAKALPDDINETICGIFSTSSIDDFRIPFINKRSELSLQTGGASGVTWRELTDMAKISYQNLVESGDWLKSNTQDDVVASFTALQQRMERLEKRTGGRHYGRGRGRGRGRNQGQRNESQNVSNQGRDTSNVTCYKCQCKGHFAKDCPNQQADEHGPWRKVPPGRNDKHDKVVAGVAYKWCGKCCLWTDHDTPHHGAQAAANPQALVAPDVKPEVQPQPVATATAKPAGSLVMRPFGSHI